MDCEGLIAIATHKKFKVHSQRRRLKTHHNLVWEKGGEFFFNEILKKNYKSRGLKHVLFSHIHSTNHKIHAPLTLNTHSVLKKI